MTALFVGAALALANISFNPINPATSITKSSLSLGLEHRQSTLTALGEIVADSERFPTESGIWRVERVSLPPSPLTVWRLTLRAVTEWPFLDGRPPWFGVDLRLPNGGQTLSGLSSPYAFTPMRYRSSDADFAGMLWVGKSLGYGLALGVGNQLHFCAAATAEARIADVATGRMLVSTGPAGSWIASVKHTTRHHTSSLLYAQKSVARLTQVVDATLVFTPDLRAGQPLSFSAATFWQPERVTVSHEWRPSQTVSLGGFLTWENWRNYEPPYLLVTAPYLVAPQSDTDTHNITIPGIYLSVETGAHNWQVQYSFRPSPLDEKALQGPANLLDTDTHAIGAAYAYTVGPTLQIGTSVWWDSFVSRTVVKTDNQMPGFPGYTLQGGCVSAGVWVSLAL